ncbi:MAG: rhodanese-like domain-containing protein [Verrucomicrobiota bacterium]|jgi:phage shock protein E
MSVNWTPYVVIGGAIIAFFLLRRISLVPVESAREWLKKGAKVIDVRSEAEYRQGHLPEAINLPLNRLRDEISRHAPDKVQPLLLHCLSGARSGIGKGMLKRMGYRQVFNLGSYGRATRILGSRNG